MKYVYWKTTWCRAEGEYRDVTLGYEITYQRYLDDLDNGCSCIAGDLYVHSETGRLFRTVNWTGPIKEDDFPEYALKKTATEGDEFEDVTGKVVAESTLKYNAVGLFIALVKETHGKKANG